MSAADRLDHIKNNTVNNIVDKLWAEGLTITGVDISEYENAIIESLLYKEGK